MAQDKCNAELVEALKTLLADIDGLMAESEGVYGLHMNGDCAPWTTLTDDGNLGGWLPLNHARTALANARDIEVAENVLAKATEGAE